MLCEAYHLTSVLEINWQIIVTVSNVCGVVMEGGWSGYQKVAGLRPISSMTHHCCVTPGCSRRIVPVISVR